MHNSSAMKLITCFLPPGIAPGLLGKLRREKGIVEASAHTARGLGKLTPREHRRVEAATEKEILTVVVPAERADEIFAYLFHEARIDRPHGGILFQNSLARATLFSLPDLPDEA